MPPLAGRGYDKQGGYIKPGVDGIRLPVTRSLCRFLPRVRDQDTGEINLARKWLIIFEGEPTEPQSARRTDPAQSRIDQDREDETRETVQSDLNAHNAQCGRPTFRRYRFRIPVAHH